jgi:hypothetical protein
MACGFLRVLTAAGYGPIDAILENAPFEVLADVVLIEKPGI